MGAREGARESLVGLGLLGTGRIERTGAGEELGRVDDAHSRDGLDGVEEDAFVLRDRFQAPCEELLDLFSHNGAIEFKALLSVSVKRRGDEVFQADRGHRAQHGDDADGGAAHRVGVGRSPSGDFVDGEDATAGVELVGDSDALAANAGGKIVTCEARTIVLADRGANLGGLTCGLGVIAAHDALLVGELDDCLRDEVCLGQMRGAHGVRDARLILAGCGSGRARELLHALDLLQGGAKLLLERDDAEALDELLHRALQVLVEEELRVVEARAHDALVAGDDGIGDLRVGVRDDHELTSKLALGVENRKIALVGEHGLADNLLRHAEELLVEGADKHGRPLAEVHDLVEDAGGRVHVAAGALGLDCGDVLANGGLAGIGAEHVGILEHLLVGSWLGNDMLARRQNAMAAGGVTARHVGVGNGHDLGAEERADPADRAHEGLVLGSQRWER